MRILRFSSFVGHDRLARVEIVSEHDDGVIRTRRYTFSNAGQLLEAAEKLGYVAREMAFETERP